MNNKASMNYHYDNAVGRNIGLLNESEQKILKECVVGVAGLGAVGGNNLLTLARMGVGNFKIADPDIFEEVNLQRQAGAFLSSLNKSKTEIMTGLVLDINPTVKIESFSEGITEKNIDQFLLNVDVVLDCIDAFQIGPRRLLYSKAKEKGIYVLFSAPKAYGASLQIFDPAGMSFDTYFGIRKGMTRAEQIAVFLLGLAPLEFFKNKTYESKLDFEMEKAPALACTVALSTGVITAEILKILLRRAKPKCIPHAFYLDAYHWKFTHSMQRPLRFKWLQKLIINICFNRFPSLKRLHLQENLNKSNVI